MIRPYVIGKLMGRCGNQFYQIATSLAYAKKHGLDHYVTSNAQNCDNDAYYFPQFNKMDNAALHYSEKRDHEDYAIFENIPPMNNAMLIGYWQCFDYFNEYREDVLKAFNLPIVKQEGYVSLHVRRGDYLNLSEKLRLMPLEYYKECIGRCVEKGYKKFLVFSDDIKWCKDVFNDFFYSGIHFDFSEGNTEVQDLVLMSGCEHNVCANSTYSYVASWLNPNPDKMVFTPDYENMFKGCHRNMIPNDYIKIKF